MDGRILNWNFNFPNFPIRYHVPSTGDALCSGKKTVMWVVSRKQLSNELLRRPDSKLSSIMKIFSERLGEFGAGMLNWEKKELAESSIEMVFPRHSSLVEIGKKSNFLYIVLAGDIKVVEKTSEHFFRVRPLFPEQGCGYGGTRSSRKSGLSGIYEEECRGNEENNARRRDAVKPGSLTVQGWDLDNTTPRATSERATTAVGGGSTPRETTPRSRATAVGGSTPRQNGDSQHDQPVLDSVLLNERGKIFTSSFL